MRSVVLGAYQTQFGELWDQSLTSLLTEAGFGAMRDAGITPANLDMAIVGNKLGDSLLGQAHLGSLIVQSFGVSIPAFRVEAACASGGLAIHQAVTAIEAGSAECVLVIGVEKMTDVNNGTVIGALMGAASEEERDSGLTFVGLYALMARAYCEKFGAGEEDLANVAVKNHFHGSMNHKAQFQFQVEIDQVLKSAVVASPLKLLDCSPITDGAAAVVVASKEFCSRQRKKKRSVKILASTLAGESLSLETRDNLTEIASTKQAADKAYSQSGLGPKDINFLEVHDCFTIAEILALEDLGFYRKGEAFVAEGNGEVRLGGKRPVNLSGGLKACGHPVSATGVKQIVESVFQLRGEANERQVDEARLALTHNVGGTGGTAVVHILAKP